MVMSSELHSAVLESNVARVNQLLSTDIDVNLRGFASATPLHLAAQTGNVEISKLLLSHDRIQLDPLDDTKDTPLRHALCGDHHEAACELLLAGADARMALYPFILLANYNQLVGYIEAECSRLEAQLQADRRMKHRLALLLQKYGLQPPAAPHELLHGQHAAIAERSLSGEAALSSSGAAEQSQRAQLNNAVVQQPQQVQQQVMGNAPAAPAAATALELRQKIDVLRQLRAEAHHVNHLSIQVCQAIVLLVKAYQDDNACSVTDKGNSSIS